MTVQYQPRPDDDGYTIRAGRPTRTVGTVTPLDGDQWLPTTLDGTDLPPTGSRGTAALALVMAAEGPAQDKVRADRKAARYKAARYKAARKAAHRRRWAEARS